MFIVIDRPISIPLKKSGERPNIVSSFKLLILNATSIRSVLTGISAM
ncbi:MAG: hypothetical protein HRT69_11475 [Flavobacteriaceae bacterium]|nr:hypothetical protein [Flavobacteriaceae bacterium]